MSVWMLIIGLQAIGQQSNVFSLSTQKPRQGKQVTFSFTPEDTKQTYKAALYIFHPSGFNADDLDMVGAGPGYSGTFTLPDSATAFLVSITADEGGKKTGYPFQVYESGSPVNGSYAALAQIYNGMGEYFADIERDVVKNEEYLEMEMASYPATKEKYFLTYIGALVANKKVDEAKGLVDERADAVFADLNSKETDLINVANGYARYLGDRETADSLKAIVLQRFPDGSLASSNELEALRAEQDYAKKTALYQTYIGKHSTTGGAANLQPVYSMMAQAALREKDYPKFDVYLAKVTNKSTRASLLNQVAWPLAEAGEKLDVAEAKSKKSLDLLDEIIADPVNSKPATMTASQWKKNAESTYRNNADTYALILYKQGNVGGALEYQRQAVGEYTSAEVNERFVQFLSESGLADEAQSAAEKSIEKGQATEVLKGYLKEIYTVRGSNEEQWVSYLSELEERHVAAVRKKLVSELIDEEAPVFSLVNMDGKTVSSESLKGKVYVVDFWATWCGPCKASFPGMQLAVDKFRDRDDIEFLFVNTWENIPDREEAVKKFIADNQYSFNVLFDTVEGDGNDFDVVGAYKVSGIPTKFIVDKNGRIRFKAVGFSGSAEGEMQKVALMIELAENAPTTAVIE